MMKINIKQWATIENLQTLGFFLFSFVFFAIFYRAHLSYQEQLQFFTFTIEHLINQIAAPGGVSTFLGSFITQFYFYPTLGAVIISILLITLQQLVLSVSRIVNGENLFYSLTFIPSIIAIALLCDENYLISGVIAFNFLALFVFLYLKIEKTKIRMLLSIIALPFIYWIIGGFYVFFSLLILTYEFRKFKKFKPLWFFFSILLISFIMPFIVKQLLPQLLLKQIFFGVGFFRFPVYSTLIFWAPPFFIVFTPFFIALLPKKITQKSIYKHIQIPFIFCATFIFVGGFADFNKEEIMVYDYYARTRQWNKILIKANKSQPHSPLSVSMLNLALGKENLLGEKMFGFFQNGTEGLFPAFSRDFTTPLMTGEIYYHLGLVNTAQRNAFESMEAIPNHNKSSRIIMRLAETSLINGDYVLTAKYLKLLQKTLFYRNWATQAMEYLGNDEKINEHSEWGQIRKNKIYEDFFFSAQEHDKMLGLLFESNKNNRMAYEYLLAYCLLSKDLKKFSQYFPLGSHLISNDIPLSHQEALIYLWGLSNMDPTQNIPFPINNSVKERVMKYGQIYTTQRDAERILLKEYSNSYWYYLHFRN